MISDRVGEVVGLTHPFDLFGFEPSALENAPELGIRLGTGNCMNNPFYFRQAI